MLLLCFDFASRRCFLLWKCIIYLILVMAFGVSDGRVGY